jgi:hypothetical protein
LRSASSTCCWAERGAHLWIGLFIIDTWIYKGQWRRCTWSAVWG